MAACNLPKLTLCFREGATTRKFVQIETGEFVWRPVTGVLNTAPVRIVVENHGCPEGWPAAITGVRQPREINAPLPLKDKDFVPVNVLDVGTVSFNKIDGSTLRPYTSGGHLVFRKPFDFTPYDSARMEVKDRVGGTQLAYYSTRDGTLQIDPVNGGFWVQPGSTFGFPKGVFDVELVKASGEADALCSADSTITILPEITTGHN